MRSPRQIGVRHHTARYRKHTRRDLAVQSVVAQLQGLQRVDDTCETATSRVRRAGFNGDSRRDLDHGKGNEPRYAPMVAGKGPDKPLLVSLISVMSCVVCSGQETPNQVQ